jgi:hypothetical protein
LLRCITMTTASNIALTELIENAEDDMARLAAL